MTDFANIKNLNQNIGVFLVILGLVFAKRKRPSPHEDGSVCNFQIVKERLCLHIFAQNS